MNASKNYTTVSATVAMMTAVSSCAKKNMLVLGTAFAVPFFMDFERLLDIRFPVFTMLQSR